MKFIRKNWIVLLSLLPIIVFAIISYASIDGVTSNNVDGVTTSNVDGATSYSGGGAPVWSCTDADVICQSAEGAGYDNAESWTAVGADSCTADPDTVTASACANGGSQVIQIVDAGVATAGPIAAYFDAGAAKDVTYTQLYFRAITIPTTNGRYTTIFTPDTAASGTGPAWRLYTKTTNGGSNFTLTLYHYNGSAHVYSDDNTSLSLNTWYGARIYYNADVADPGQGIYWDLDLDLDGTFGDEGVEVDTDLDETANRTPRYYHFSGCIAAGDTSTIQVDMIKVDTSAFPAAACP